jgi:hypothetical protein
MSRRQIKIDLLDFWFPNTLEAKMRNSVYIFLERLLEPNYELQITDDPQFLIYSAYGGSHVQYDKCVKIFITPENVRPNFSECDYAFTFDHLQHPRHFRLPLYRIDLNYPKVRGYRHPQQIQSRKSKFCCFIVSNPNAQFRIDFFHKLSAYNHVDSAGKHLNNVGYHIPVTPWDKLAFMQPYKFCIARLWDKILIQNHLLTIMTTTTSKM